MLIYHKLSLFPIYVSLIRRISIDVLLRLYDGVNNPYSTVFSIKDIKKTLSNYAPIFKIKCYTKDMFPLIGSVIPNFMLRIFETRFGFYLYIYGIINLGFIS